MRRTWGLFMGALLVAACGGGDDDADVSTDSAAPTTRPSNVVIVDETTTTEPANTAPATQPATTANDGTEVTSTTDADTTTTTAENAAPTTTSPLVAPIGDRLIEMLFGAEPPQRVVLIDADVIEDHREGAEPFATRHPLAQPFALVEGPWIQAYDVAGQAAVARIDDPGERLDLPDGWLLAGLDSGPAMVEGSCATEPTPTVEVRSVESFEPASPRPVFPLDPRESDVGCTGAYLRGGAALAIDGDPEGNANAIVNRDGVSVVGNDYAGYLSLDHAGNALVYTDQGESPSPHIGLVIVVRRVSDGVEVGRWETLEPVTNLEFDGRWVVASVPDLEFHQRGLLSLDTQTGEQRFVESTTTLLLPTP